jgi:RNA polymerase sigma-70 factor, ECF subfamily
MVFGISRLLLRDPVEAEDAAQQTFLSAYRSLLAGQEPHDPSAWLGTIARNECRSRLRARQTEPLGLEQEPAGDELQRDLGRREEIQALCAALAGLPPQQREAVVLREFYGLSYAEVAAALGLTGAAVESLLFRGRKRLQEQLRPGRSALGVLTLPVTLRDSLAQSLPGFGAGAVSTGAGGAVLAKLVSAPLAAKLAAATLAIGTVGTVAGVEQSKHVEKHRAAAPTHTQAPTRARPKPVAVAVRTSEPVAVRPVAVQPAALRTGRARTAASTRHEGQSDQQGTSGHGGGGEVEHRSASTTTTTSGGDDGRGGGSSGSGSATVSGGTSNDGGGGSGAGSGDSGSGGSGGSGSSGDRGATGESGHDGGSGSGS